MKYRLISTLKRKYILVVCPSHSVLSKTIYRVFNKLLMQQPIPRPGFSKELCGVSSSSSFLVAILTFMTRNHLPHDAG